MPSKLIIDNFDSQLFRLIFFFSSVFVIAFIGLGEFSQTNNKQ